MDSRQTLDEIRGILNSGKSIPGMRLAEWLTCDDLEVLGACHEALTEHFDRLDAKGKTRFREPSEFVCARMLEYFRRCLLENRPGEFAGNRFQAGRCLYNWFLSLSARDVVEPEMLDDIKQMLADVYKFSGREVRDCIVTSCLEHLFESRRIAEYFSDWAEDPALKAAYAEALEWGRGFWPGQRGY